MSFPTFAWCRELDITIPTWPAAVKPLATFSYTDGPGGGMTGLFGDRAAMFTVALAALASAAARPAARPASHPKTRTRAAG